MPSCASICAVPVRSEGLPDDEYAVAEQDDIIAAIAWIAEQPWCTGKLGMMGISWGGFNGLQVAARQPEALKAIITVDASDDRYNDDVHYMQGILLHDNFSWASAMYAYAVLPPDPELVGDALAADVAGAAAALPDAVPHLGRAISGATPIGAKPR